MVIHVTSQDLAGTIWLCCICLRSVISVTSVVCSEASRYRRVVETAVEQRVLVVSSLGCDIRRENLVCFNIGLCNGTQKDIPYYGTACVKQCVEIHRV